MNTFGNLFKLTSFGESHGVAIGGVIDGCPAGIVLDIKFIQNELNRRKPGQSELTTSRNELDKVEFLSGIYKKKTTGAPIGFIVKNKDQHSLDYNKLKNIFRPSHADYTYFQKYGHRDHRGGGRSSARETIARVIAGAVAKLVLKKKGIKITAYVSQVGNICLNKYYTQLDFSNIEKTPIRCPDLKIANQMIELIRQIKLAGDTIGGVVTCICQTIPLGLGNPVFGKLNAALSYAMMSINATKGFDYGMGFNGIHQKGSEVNDLFDISNGKIITKSNYSGGIQGGISNGEYIYFRVAFKPVATLLQKQLAINKEGKKILLKIKGRHDPCVLPRAIPIVESMAAITILDYYLLYYKTLE